MRGVYIIDNKKVKNILSGEIVELRHKIDKPLHITVGETIYVRETRFMSEKQAKIFLQVISSDITNKEYIIRVKML